MAGQQRLPVPALLWALQYQVQANSLERIAHESAGRDEEPNHASTWAQEHQQVYLVQPQRGAAADAGQAMPSRKGLRQTQTQVYKVLVPKS